MIKCHAQLLSKFSFFLSFLVLTSLYQIIVGVEVILIIYRTHTRARAVGFLWTRDRSVQETSTRKHATVIRDKYPCPPPVGYETAAPASERPQTHASVARPPGLAKEIPCL